ncbi:BBP7 family outer membrane beta-barrel protein [Posidoniimonas polymericola]|nr:BBP7 family outer membrane beta-barrel protein [Posidoniimonas polymericola]
MTIRVTVASIAAAIVTAVLACQPTEAQVPYGGPQGFYNSGPSQMMDAHGDPAVIPAQYCQGGCPPGYGGGGGYGDPAANYCPMTEQCGPHYFDFSAEYLMYQRSDYGSLENQSLMTLNVLPGGTEVLNIGDIPSDYQSGFRLTGRYDIGALSVIEVGYTGFFDMGGGASFTDPAPVDATTGNLYSLYSDFGQNPVGAVGVSGATLAETDQAVSAYTTIETVLQSAELSYRRYWVGHSPRVTGTWLYGFRWTRLKDEFNFATQANGTYVNYIEAENDLAGFQLGADAWMTVIQGLRIGLEGKTGIYGNQVDIRNRANTSPAATVSIDERFSNEQVSFLGEARLMAVADITPCISLKAGYEVLYMSSVATSVDNFNAASPYAEGQGIPRQSLFQAQSDAMFHGFHAGFEYVW